MSEKYNEQHAATMLNALLPTETLQKHDSQVRAKFAEWLDANGFMRKMDLNISRVEEALYKYEKEQGFSNGFEEDKDCGAEILIAR